MQSTYWQKYKNTRIAVLGICPPPLGGVSVHVSRLIEHLKDNNDVFFFNTEPRYRYRLIHMYLAALVPWFCWKRPRVVIYHSGYLPNSITELRTLIWLKQRFSFSLVVVEHNCQHLDKRSAVEKKVWQDIINNVDEMVLIGDSTHKSYERNGIRLKQFIIDSPFLSSKVLSYDYRELYPSSFFQFMQAHCPLIFMNASQVKMIDAGGLYGFDLALVMLERLRINFPTVGLVIFLARVGDARYFECITKKIKEWGLEESVFFMHDNKPLWPALPFAHCFIRPTLLDGFSISVIEALHAGIPAVVSDAVKRPEGVILYKTRDADDFTKCVRNVFIGRGFSPTESGSST